MSIAAEKVTTTVAALRIRCVKLGLDRDRVYRITDERELSELHDRTIRWMMTARPSRR